MCSIYWAHLLYSWAHLLYSFINMLFKQHAYSPCVLFIGPTYSSAFRQRLCHSRYAIAVVSRQRPLINRWKYHCMAVQRFDWFGFNRFTTYKQHQILLFGRILFIQTIDQTALILPHFESVLLLEAITIAYCVTAFCLIKRVFSGLGNKMETMSGNHLLLESSQICPPKLQSLISSPEAASNMMLWPTIEPPSVNNLISKRIVLQ